ncbi:hypothetical protein [Thiomicrorhabdus sp.]|uniref:hypothetical protein n=1 Tax=Thiomicrorhabdus sp. TaxID=2039724 RepID=UPI00356805F5
MAQNEPNEGQISTQAKSTLERHVQTILVSLITAAIIYVSVNLSHYQEQMARFEERMIALTDKIDGLLMLREDVEDNKVRIKVLESKHERER